METALASSTRGTGSVACGETGVTEEAVRGVIGATWGIEVEAKVIDAASVTEGEARRSNR
jgi:hypothetical protein